jgi:hypothetical protein
MRILNGFIGRFCRLHLLCLLVVEKMEGVEDERWKGGEEKKEEGGTC